LRLFDSLHPKSLFHSSLIGHTQYIFLIKIYFVLPATSSFIGLLLNDFSSRENTFPHIPNPPDFEDPGQNPGGYCGAISSFNFGFQELVNPKK